MTVSQGLSPTWDQLLFPVNGAGICSPGGIKSPGFPQEGVRSQRHQGVSSKGKLGVAAACPALCRQGALVSQELSSGRLCPVPCSTTGLLDELPSPGPGPLT